MRDNPRIRQASGFRLAFLVLLLVASCVAWATWSRSSPWFGWPEEAIEAARRERLRESAVPPCRSEEWTRLRLHDGVDIEVPSCFERTLGDSGAVLFDGASNTLIAVLLYRGGTSDPSGMARSSGDWEPCGAPGRDDVYCRVQRSRVVGGAVTFRSTLVVAPSSAILLQTMFPGYLDGTSHEESVRNLLSDIASKSSRAEHGSEDVNPAGVEDFRRWLSSSELAFMLTAAVAQAQEG